MPGFSASTSWFDLVMLHWRTFFSVQSDICCEIQIRLIIRTYILHDKILFKISCSCWNQQSQFILVIFPHNFGTKIQNVLGSVLWLHEAEIHHTLDEEIHLTYPDMFRICLFGNPVCFCLRLRLVRRTPAWQAFGKCHCYLSSLTMQKLQFSKKLQCFLSSWNSLQMFLGYFFFFFFFFAFLDVSGHSDAKKTCTIRKTAQLGCKIDSNWAGNTIPCYGSGCLVLTRLCSRVGVSHPCVTSTTCPWNLSPHQRNLHQLQ